MKCSFPSCGSHFVDTILLVPRAGVWDAVPLAFPHAQLSPATPDHPQPVRPDKIDWGGGAVFEECFSNIHVCIINYIIDLFFVQKCHLSTPCTFGEGTPPISVVWDPRSTLFITSLLDSQLNKSEQSIDRNEVRQWQYNRPHPSAISQSPPQTPPCCGYDKHKCRRPRTLACSWKMEER